LNGETKTMQICTNKAMPHLYQLFLKQTVTQLNTLTF